MAGELQIENGDEWLAAIEHAIANLNITGESALVALGDDIGQRMRQRGPRQKGAARHGIDTVEVTQGRGSSGFYVDVGPTAQAFYLAYAEFGTQHQPARPWARPSIAEAVTAWRP